MNSGRGHVRHRSRSTTRTSAGVDAADGINICGRHDARVRRRLDLSPHRPRQLHRRLRGAVSGTYSANLSVLGTLTATAEIRFQFVASTYTDDRGQRVASASTTSTITYDAHRHRVRQPVRHPPSSAPPAASPPRASITLTFNVTVDDPFPTGADQILNTATQRGDRGPDPAVGERAATSSWCPRPGARRSATGCGSMPTRTASSTRARPGCRRRGGDAEGPVGHAAAGHDHRQPGALHLHRRRAGHRLLRRGDGRACRRGSRRRPTRAPTCAPTPSTSSTARTTSMPTSGSGRARALPPSATRSGSTSTRTCSATRARWALRASPCSSTKT